MPGNEIFGLSGRPCEDFNNYPLAQDTLDISPLTFLLYSTHN